MEHIILEPKAQAFKEYLESDKKILPSTIQNYSRVANRFLLEHPGPYESSEPFNHFINEHGIQKRGCVYSQIKKFVRFFIEDKVLQTKIVRQLIRPEIKQPRKIRKYLSIDERKKVISYMQSLKHKIIAGVQLYTGCRAREILSLKRGNISNEKFTDKNGNVSIIMKLLILGKGSKEAFIFIHNQELMQAIDDYTQYGEASDYDYYFLQDREISGSLLVSLDTNYHWYYVDLKQAVLKCGHKMSDFATHDFRRCAGSDVWDQTHDPLSTQRFLRHAQFSTTERYLESAGSQNKDTSSELSKLYR